MTAELKQICKSLRLAHVADIYESIPFENPTQFVEALLKKELELRDEAKAERLIKKREVSLGKDARLFRVERESPLSSSAPFKELVKLYFIDRKENLIFTGSTGTGKTHLATALGYEACRKGFEVRFYRLSDLAEALEKAWAEGKWEQFRNRFKTVDLVILDEMGYVPFNKERAELFFQLISDWYEQTSLIITSNLEFGQWNRVFSDSRLTAALVDRVIHHAHTLNFTVESFRLSNALSRQK